ncbi:hypothetical protein IHQ68_19115 [Chelatococcus sambhunathii]|uniref:Uncharacterized protein n=1 Tax=Chelatococcus sambhunathii TaxID=363953 RepID=A0ABU1DKY7_9HYPH|nr:hypothetical protein [Chelatococcus sambhunathii]MDR4308736.1 hypothetical protein [Chelatococcus sambhunathii]
MNDDGQVVKDPVSPEHKRFVLAQASLRLWLMAAVVVALLVWMFVEL